VPVTIQVIRKQFDLSPDVSTPPLLILYQEDLYDDFGCTLKKGDGRMIRAPGRLYLTDDNLCFFSNIVGKPVSIVSVGLLLICCRKCNWTRLLLSKRPR